MAMMTALGEAPSIAKHTMVARYASARKRPDDQKCGQVKSRPAGLKASGGRQISGSDQLVRRREVGSCWARHAGPGPRIYCSSGRYGSSALEKNWRQRARSSTKEPDRPPRLRVGEGREPVVMVAMTNPVFFPAASVARSAFWGADGQFRAEVIKRRFQLSLSVFLLVNRWKTLPPRLPFGGRAATSAQPKFP